MLRGRPAENGLMGAGQGRGGGSHVCAALAGASAGGPVGNTGAHTQQQGPSSLGRTPGAWEKSLHTRATTTPCAPHAARPTAPHILADCQIHPQSSHTTFL